ncbi:MAG: hypothetical protein V1736_03930 [Pseudomonadota bacterium]
MIRSIGPYIIVRKAEWPLFRQAYRLSRAITDVQIDDILHGRKHIHSNPSRKLRVIASDKCQAETEEIA